MASTTFVLKEPNSKKETLVFLIFRYENQRIKISTGEKINPKNWNTRLQKAREHDSFREYPEFNIKLDNLRMTINNLYRKYINDNNGQTPSKPVLRELINDSLSSKSSKKSVDFISYFEWFIENSHKRVSAATGKLVGPNTIKKYRTVLNCIIEYQTARKKNVDFDTINLAFYDDFVEYLISVRNSSTNTIGDKYIKTIKTVLNHATETGINKNLEYKNSRFKAIREDSFNIYLNEDEIAQIYNLDLTENPRLERVRDLFIMGCWTGVRFSDLQKITPENIVGEMIVLETSKTSQRLNIPLSDELKEIMEKYKDRGQLIPKPPSNQKMNKYIKEVCALVPILDTPILKSITKGGKRITQKFRKHELVSSHTARRSFATNLYNSGFPSINIRMITGHKTEAAFLKYIKITEEENARKLQEHWNKNKAILKLA